jgi:hypothetical protein
MSTLTIFDKIGFNELQDNSYVTLQAVEPEIESPPLGDSSLVTKSQMLDSRLFDTKKASHRPKDIKKKGSSKNIPGCQHSTAAPSAETQAQETAEAS